MTDKKTSEAQLKASKKWDNAHKEQKRYTSYKSTTKMVLSKLAKNEDLKMMKEIIDKRLNN